MKEIKVRLYSHMNDSFNELYKVLDGDTKVKYFARHCWNDGGTWYFVADPLGYCELDYSCPEDYIFAVCDYKGNELFKDSNGEISNPFPTLERKTKMVWNNIKDKYPIIDGLNDWLLSFLTQDVLKTKLKNEYCPYDNWTMYWAREEKSKEIIERFEHLGEQFRVYKVTKKHTYCDCEWIEYLAGPEEMDEYTSYITYYGAWFDGSVVGDAYSKNVARDIVEKVLQEIYPDRKYLSRVKEDWGVAIEKKYKLWKAAELLIGNNYDKSNVEAVIEEERNNPSFYSDDKSIKKDFGRNVRWDYGY